MSKIREDITADPPHLSPLSLPNLKLFHSDDFEEAITASWGPGEKKDIRERHVGTPIGPRFEGGKQHESVPSPRVEQRYDEPHIDGKKIVETASEYTGAIRVLNNSQNQPGPRPRVTLIRSPNNDEEIVPVGSEPLIYYNAFLDKHLPFLPDAPDTQTKEKEPIWGRLKRWTRKIADVLGVGTVGTALGSSN